MPQKCLAGPMNAGNGLEAIMTELRARADPAALAGLARFGIATDTALGGSSIPQLRAMAKRIGKDHETAAALWSTEVHEARLLATMVDDPAKVTEAQMDAWAEDFRSWDLCDQCCTNLFRRTPWAWSKAETWPNRHEEMVKRAGFALMAILAVHDGKAPDGRFIDLLDLMEREADDGRNYVRKAVNWALRQVGKRSLALNAAAIERARRIGDRGTPSARWISSNALRELESPAVKARLRSREVASPSGRRSKRSLTAGNGRHGSGGSGGIANL
jgi:3-methyladenine DNA glycosylase AlkD